MAHLLRLIFALLLLWSGGAHALIPKVTGWYAPSQPSPVTIYETAEQACRGYMAVLATANPGNTYVFVGVRGGGTGTTDTCDYKSNGINGAFSVQMGGSVCPANSSAVSGGCQCNSPYVENAAHTACEEPPDPCKALKGQSAGDWWRDTGDDNGLPAKIGFSVCDKYQSIGGGLCVATVPSTGGLCMQTEGGWWRCTGQAFYTGDKAADATKCSPAGPGGSGNSPTDPMPSTPPSGDPPKPPGQPAPGTAAPAPCPAGQAPGDINGTRVCAPTGGDRPSTTAAPGTGSTTTNNSDGSSTTSTTSGTTKCIQGVCSTITNNTNVTTNVAGNDTCPTGQAKGSTTVNGQARTTCTGTTSSNTSQAQSGFCEKNPKDKQCGGDGSDTAFGGSCAGGFKASSEDAVINAMAEEQYRRNCQMFDTDSEERQGYEADKAKAKAGTDLTEGMGDKYKRSVSIGPGDFDSTSAIAISQCIRDLPISVFGLSISLPFSRICPYLEYMGMLLMAVSYLLAARIVVRG